VLFISTEYIALLRSFNVSWIQVYKLRNSFGAISYKHLAALRPGTSCGWHARDNTIGRARQKGPSGLLP